MTGTGFAAKVHSAVRQSHHGDLLLTIPKLLGISGISAVDESKFAKGTLEELVLA